MEHLSCLIVDDESISRRFLEHYIQEIDFLDLVQSCGDATEALIALKKHPIDIVFLDIEMPEKSGLQLLEELDYKPAVILVTAKEQYAVKAYELDVVDYLVKPITFSRLEKAITKAKKFLDTNSTKPEDDELFVKVSSKFVKIKHSDIQYIEAQGDYVQLHTIDKRFTIYTSMSDILKRLPESKFIRIHRSFIVYLPAVKKVQTAEVQLHDVSLPLGGSYKKEFLIKIKGNG